MLPECIKMRIFRCNFGKFSQGHAPGPLPPKLICAVTRLWRNFDPSQKFFAYATGCELEYQLKIILLPPKISSAGCGPVRKYRYSRLNTWWWTDHVIFYITLASWQHKPPACLKLSSVTAYCAQHHRLRCNFRVAIIFNAWWKRRAYYVICSSWAANVYVKGFNLQNILNFHNTRPRTVKNYSVAHRLRNPGVND